jgi:hypothetical protein
MWRKLVASVRNLSTVNRLLVLLTAIYVGAAIYANQLTKQQNELIRQQNALLAQQTQTAAQGLALQIKQDSERPLDPAARAALAAQIDAAIQQMNRAHEQSIAPLVKMRDELLRRERLRQEQLLHSPDASQMIILGKEKGGKAAEVSVLPR